MYMWALSQKTQREKQAKVLAKLGKLIFPGITLPEKPLNGEKHHPYSHRPSRVDPGTEAGRLT